jgi:hypothetical protein
MIGGIRDGNVQRFSSAVCTASFLSFPGACVVHQQTANNRGSSGHYLGPVRDINVSLLQQLQISVVDQHRGLQRVTGGFAHQGSFCESMQLVVNRFLPAGCDFAMN